MLYERFMSMFLNSQNTTEIHYESRDKLNIPQIFAMLFVIGSNLKTWRAKLQRLKYLQTLSFLQVMRDAQMISPSPPLPSDDTLKNTVQLLLGVE